MIRRYSPIGLIPAAWAMTLATMTYQGISMYWIQHMHYFMILFLTGFTVISWTQMESDPVLDIWRKVIGAGIFITILGALSFTLTPYSQILGFSSLTYWFLAPGSAIYYSSEHMDRYSGLYKKLSEGSIVGFAVFILGLYSEVISLQIMGLIGIAVIQTVSMIIASKLDS